MCGFSIYEIGGTSIDSLLERSQQTVGFRGRDGTSYCINNNTIFIHHRLTIIDENNGAQPLSNDTGILVYNGEIYNFNELSTTYLGEESSGDSTFLQKLCDNGRWELLSKIDGYFAFVYKRHVDDTYICGRDLFGEKPLYKSKEQLNFSSSIRGVSKLNSWNWRLCIESLFAEEREDWERILYKGYEVIPPNTLSVYTADGTLQNRQQIYKKPTDPIKYEDFLGELSEATNRRLVSDFPVSQSLSAGKDSGLINQILIKSQTQIERYTLRNRIEKYDESKTVEKLCKTGNVVLNIIDEDSLSKEDTISIILAQEVPAWDMSFIGFFSYYRSIAASHKVILEGHGPDELLGGYQDYSIVATIHELLSGSFSAAALRFKVANLVTGRNPLRNLFSVSLFLIRGLVFRKKHYINMNAYFKRQHVRLSSVLGVFDRATMLAGIESRSPYLSYRLVKYYENFQESGWRNYLEPKALVSHCIRKINGSIEIQARKVGFTFSDKNNIEEIFRQIDINKNIETDRVYLLSRFFPKKYRIRLYSYAIFYSLLKQNETV